MTTFARMLGRGLLAAALTASSIFALTPSRAFAQPVTSATLTGAFRVGYEDYNDLPLVVGLADTTGYYGKDPIFLLPSEDQIIGSYTGQAGNGKYELALPAQPKGRPFDVTTGKVADQVADGAGVLLFDVRLMSDVASRKHMIENEDPIASSVKIEIGYELTGGTFIVWAADDKAQFPTSAGADKQLFTADDPRAPLPKGYAAVNIDSEPYKVTPIVETLTLDLITTGGGDVIDYANLSCAEYIPAFLDRVQKNYPFTAEKQIDWAKLRDQLIPASKTAKTAADCEKLIQIFGNTVPDGHVNFNLPTLLGDNIAGGLGMLLNSTSDGAIVVAAIRPNGPADQAGIKPGAIIRTWAGKPINETLAAMTLLYANSGTAHGLLDIKLFQILIGKLGSTAEVGFVNPDGKEQTATLTRDRRQRTPVNAETIAVKDGKLASGLGYIALPTFNSYEVMLNFDKRIDQYIKENVPAIIIDVRGNGGGWSQISDALSSRFFDKFVLVGDTVTEDGRTVYTSRLYPREPVYTGLVAILVDANSASAADLFAYSFKLTKRGLIVGQTPSAGMMGTVSGGQYYLPNDAFIQVPTAGIVNQAGQQVIEGTGVAPDLLVPRTVESILDPKDEVLRAAEQALLDGQKP